MCAGGGTYSSYEAPAPPGVTSRKVAFGTAVGGVAPTGVAGGVDRSMKAVDRSTEAVAAPDVRELAAGECAARFGDACEFLARASITRFENCRRRLGEDFAGLDISDKWRTKPAAAAWAPPGERPVIPRNLALDCSTEI